jgi:hypothetical protein
MVSRRVLRVIIAVALGLLFVLLSAVFVVGALAWVLGAMGDQTGRIVLEWIGLALGTFVLIDLLMLVLALGVHSLEDRGQPPDEPE